MRFIYFLHSLIVIIDRISFQFRLLSSAASKRFLKTKKTLDFHCKKLIGDQVYFSENKTLRFSLLNSDFVTSRK